MRILWYKKKYFDIDLDTATWVEMIKALNQNGHITRLITGYKRKKVDYGINIKYIRTMPFRYLNHIIFSLLIFFSFPFFFISFKPDAIITDSVTSLVLLPFRLLLRLFGLRTAFILDIRTLYDNKFFQLLLNMAAKLSDFSSDGVTVITPAMLHHLESIRGKRFTKPVGIWSSGVNIELFNPDRIPPREIDSIRSKFKAKFLVLYHGSIVQGRGLEETVSAMKYLRNFEGELKLILLGGGKLVPKLLRLVEMEDLKNLVNILEPVPIEQVPFYIAASDVGILPMPDSPKRATSSYIKLLEYLAMNIPVILTDIEAHRLVVDKSKFALFIKNSDPEEIAKGIRMAYENRDQLSFSAKDARKLVQNKFTWEKQAEKLSTFVNSVKKSLKNNNSISR